MVRRKVRRKELLSVLAVVLAGVAVGCGGGGGGGSRSLPGTIVDSGGAVGQITTGGTTGAEVTTGGGTPVVDIDPTTGGATTGEVTPPAETSTGGTVGTDPTTGSSTTGEVPPSDTTGSVVDPTTGGASAGSTDGGTVDPTTGGSTTGGDPSTSGGNPTTGGSGGDPTGGDSTGGSSTTGGDSTGTTTGSTPPPSGGTTGTGNDTTGGGTTGGSTGAGNGVLRPNAIYFGRWGDPSVVSSILPDGSGRLDECGSGADVVAAIPDPRGAGSYVYAKMVDGACGVYRGTSFDPSASTELLAPRGEGLFTLQASGGDAILAVRIENGSGVAYRIADGSAQAIDAASGGAISLDGNLIAYTKFTVGTEVLYLWNRLTGETRVLSSNGDSILPSFSKDGAWVLFSSNRDASSDSPYDLYQARTSDGTVERITNTPDVNELGACYNENRTLVSYVGLTADPSISGLYVLSNAGTRRIATDPDLGLATYWTDASGRSHARRRGARFQALPRQRVTFRAKAKRR